MKLEIGQVLFYKDKPQFDPDIVVGKSARGYVLKDLKKGSEREVTFSFFGHMKQHWGMHYG